MRLICEWCRTMVDLEPDMEKCPACGQAFKDKISEPGKWKKTFSSDWGDVWLPIYLYRNYFDPSDPYGTPMIPELKTFEEPAPPVSVEPLQVSVSPPLQLDLFGAEEKPV